MAHLPMNHPARPYLRVLVAAIGGYVLAFGIAGIVQTGGDWLFDRGDHWVLGLRTNPAFSILSIMAGAVLLAAAVIGRNLDHFLGVAGGGVFLVAGVVMMAPLHTGANLLNFAMPNVIVSFLIGLALLASGLYSRSGPPAAAEAEEKFRHSEIGADEFEKSAGNR